MHDSHMDLKLEISKEIKGETTNLRDDILKVKTYFDEQKDYVTQFDSTL